jgi:hypothetical protein
MSPLPGLSMAEAQLSEVSDLNELALSAQSGGAAPSETLLRFVRRIRQERRYDLLRKCLVLLRPDTPNETLREVVMLCLDADALDDLKALVASRPDAEIALTGAALLRLLDAWPTVTTAHAAPVLVAWPKEALAHAAGTSVFNVQEQVICRQKALIEKLLARSA